MTWSDSIFFRLLATWEYFIGKIYPMTISCRHFQQSIEKSSDFWWIIIKSKNPNAWVIFSSTNFSLLAKDIWVLTKGLDKNFLSKHIWHDVAEETAFMIEWTVIFRPSNVWQDVNHLQNILRRHFAANQTDHHWLK